MIRLTLAALLLAGSASAATITETGIHDFTDAFGPVVGQRGTIVTDLGTFKGNAPGGVRAWAGCTEFDRCGSSHIDSRWSNVMRWDARDACPKGCTIRFNLQDAWDIPNTRGFKIVAGDATFTDFVLAESGNLRGFAVDFLRGEDAIISFRRKGPQGGFHRPGADAEGVRDATIQPVPLPAAAWLLLAGLGAMAWVKRRVV